ncbi:hypothetical protein GCM10023066_56510 [Nocardioides kongjuensis]
MPMITHAGLRRFIRSWRLKTIQDSRKNVLMPVLLRWSRRRGRAVLRLAAASASRSERPVRVRKDVVEGGADDLDRLQADPGVLQVAQQAGDGLAGPGDPAADVVALDLDVGADRASLSRRRRPARRGDLEVDQVPGDGRP